ncbi:3-isopropylmalate dehydratase small subunit [Prochlorococcus sp. MIT 1341]|uniref:3-isopropylmalate dehydratase small subunit n=1 Tax=Prochlorococcus sp. MIT 1341 TaxID=3096221 RepID=UPI002A7520FF|nr:3-isopropylmalate dehydratase small subunit [Prochlorococcus sp. MIT 1341]
MRTNPYFPKGIIERVEGQAISLRGDDIDTDRIIPARYLKCISFEHLGESVFADDRNELQGNHPFDRKENKCCSILIVNKNFGCGSSREHAPQALMRWGIRAIIGESFAEIFYGNCLALGIPCATGITSTIKNIQETTELGSQKALRLDLTKKKLESQNKSWEIDIEEMSRKMLIQGSWDATSELIKQSKALNQKIKNLPYLNNFFICQEKF